MTARIERARGTHDVIPAEMPLWMRVTGEIDLNQVDLPDPLAMERLPGTDLWTVTTVLPEGSRVEYQIEVRRGARHEQFNDPLNPRLEPVINATLPATEKA